MQRAIVVENKWRAQRYGVHGTFVVDGKALSVAEMLDRLIDDTAAEAESLGCSADIERCRTIVSGRHIGRRPARGVRRTTRNAAAKRRRCRR